MKIASSNIQLDSSRDYLFQRETRENLRVQNGDQSLSISRSSDELVVEGSRERFRGLNVAGAGIDDVLLSNAAEPVTVDTLAEVEEEDASLIGTKLGLTKKILETLTGREIKLTKVETIDREEAEARAARFGETVQAEQGGTPRGFGLAYDRTTETYEAERTEFQAQGVVKTADGREIAFAVDLELSREYRSSENVSLRIGNLTDPLVINFDGDSARLTDQKFEFDLDSDGENEEVSFLRSNSGFLAFDRNGDGVINDGSELFGPTTGDGFDELAAYDEDGNSFIDEGDSVYNKLSVYNKTEAGDQLTALADTGVGAIYLGRAETEFSLNDAQNETDGKVRSTGVYIDEEGSVGTVQQVDLSA